MERPTQTLLKEAADWFVRLQEAENPAATRETFDGWLLRSPAHIEAYLRVSQTWGDVALVSGEGFAAEELVAAACAEPAPANVLALSDTEASKSAPWKRKNRVWQAPAATAAVLALVVAGAWLYARTPHVTTAVGEQRSILLSDGSVAYLNTNSELQVRYTPEERRLDLVRGEARFTVARNAARPFLVVTDQVRIRALGTIFNVQAFTGRTAVTVIEGKVAVVDVAGKPVPAADGIKVQKGEHLAVTRQGDILPGAGPTIERVIGWPQRQLVFREETLASVVAEFNRYHRESIRIGNPQLAGLKISAVFDSSDSASLIQYLEKYRGVHSQRPGEGGVILSLPR